MLARQMPGHCPGVVASAPGRPVAVEALYLDGGLDTRPLTLPCLAHLERVVYTDLRPGLRRDESFVPRLCEAMLHAGYVCASPCSPLAHTRTEPGVLQFVKDGDDRRRAVEYRFNDDGGGRREHFRTLVVGDPHRSPPRALVDALCADAGLTLVRLGERRAEHRDARDSLEAHLDADPAFRARFITFVDVCDGRASRYHRHRRRGEQLVDA